MAIQSAKGFPRSTRKRMTQTPLAKRPDLQGIMMQGGKPQGETAREEIAEYPKHGTYRTRQEPRVFRP
jgi:hypothetical protein